MKKEEKAYERPDIDEYFLKIASVVAERSTCLRRRVGAVAVRDKHILATGYNGAPAGLSDCLSLGCVRDKLGIPSGHQHEICRAVHAEQNVIIQAALHGTSLEGATIYCTIDPCILCKKMLINVKIKRFVTYAPYAKSLSEGFIDFSPRGYIDVFEEAGIMIDQKPIPSGQISGLPLPPVTSFQTQKSVMVTTKHASRGTTVMRSPKTPRQKLPF